MTWWFAASTVAAAIIARLASPNFIVVGGIFLYDEGIIDLI